MKTILVIGDDQDGKQWIAETCRKWWQDFSVPAVSDESGAHVLLQQNAADLIICDLASRPGTLPRSLQQLTYSFPYIPCIAVIRADEHSAEDFLKFGVSSCLEIPVKDDELRRWISELLDISTSGTVKGIPIHSLLQMLQAENKTCTLKVTRDGSDGFIYMDKGLIAAAETDDLTNEDAAYEIIAWEKTRVEIKFYNCQREPLIAKSLMALVMESFRRKDERDSLASRQGGGKKAGMDLKHFSTSGKNLSLENGLKVKLELDNGSEPFSCALVGMIPEKYLIVSPPETFARLSPTVSAEVRIVAKYMQMGRLCMFKTELKHTLQEPERLLFLEYPQVIHYLELRRAKRMVIFIPSTLQLTNGARFNSVLLDLSSTGCLCQVRVARNKGLPSLDMESRIFLYCLFPGVKEEIELTGIVKNTKKTGSELRAGVEFLNLEPYSRETITGYLQSLEN
jgi:CheY-like chemotaxis protein/c-di-GMP-binding flagellar brake protein YcgR